MNTADLTESMESSAQTQSAETARTAGVGSSSEFTDWLVREGLIAASDLARAETLAAREHVRLATMLTQLGILSEDVLADAFAACLGIPRLSTDNWPDEIPLMASLPPRFLRHAGAAPVTEEDGHILIAMADPGDTQTAAALAAALKQPVRIAVSTHSDITAAIARSLETTESPASAHHAQAFSVKDAALLRDKASEAPVIRAADDLLDDALSKRASDIHIEPGAQGLAIRLRIDGSLRGTAPRPGIDAAALVSRLKLIGGLDIAESRLPQDGRIRTVLRGHGIDLRIATVPTLHGEAVSIRLLDRERAPLDLDRLGYKGQTLDAMRSLLSRPDGLMLVTGPTGSGKTTTLYAALRTLSDGKRKIMSIEDPVEYDLDGVSQIQVHPETGLTFASALRSILRHDPDIILVGEIRDSETAAICIQAALTGHLVLATLHTRRAASAITRLMDMGIPAYLISATLIGVVAQRLARRSGSDGEERGRIALAEILTVTDDMRALVSAGATDSDLEDAARTAGMIPMIEDGFEKSARGLISRAEVLRLCSEAL